MSAPLLVDVTRVVRTILAEALPEARVVTELPGNLVDVLPAVRVVRIGGTDDGVILDSAMLSVHAFDSSDASTRALAYSTAAALREARGVVHDGAVITRVTKVGGPAFANYENTYLRHHVTTFLVDVKYTA